MTKIKKLVLGLTIALTIASTLIVGIIFNLNSSKKSNVPLGEPVDSSNNIELPIYEDLEPKTYSFSEGEVSIQKGSEIINFEYSKDINARATSVAYEYIFNNPMSSEMAINLKSINTTNVTVSYTYSSTKLTNVTSGSSPFELQKISTNATKYIYIIVTPTSSSVPTTFKSSVVWYQGKAGTVTIYNRDGSVLATRGIVKGQPMAEPTAPTLSTGEEFDGWFADSTYEDPAVFTSMQTMSLYPKVYPAPNLPSDWIAYNSTKKAYYVKKGTSTLPTNLIIPKKYTKDGVTADVTYIASSTSASAGVFYQQKGLISVQFPITMTNIGNFAFSGCNQITTLSLSEGLTTIGKEAFRDCSKIVTIDIPSTVTSIGADIIKGCTRIATIVVDEDNTAYDSRNDCNAIIKKSNKTLMFGCKNTVIPDGVEAIGKEAFSWHSGLTTINIPASVKTVGSMIFNGCSGLATITVDDNNQTFCDKDSNAIITKDGKNLVAGCKKTVIPNTVKTIGVYAFCTGTGTNFSISVPEGVEEIKDYGFSNSRTLTSINIPSSCTKIGANAFTLCNGLTSVTFNNTKNWYYKNSADGDGVDGVNVTTASTNASSLKSGTYQTKHLQRDRGNLPDDWIGYDSENNTYYVKKGTSSLPTNLIMQTYCFTDGNFGPVTAMEGDDYDPDTTKMDDGMFYGTGIQSIELSSKLTNIGSFAFAGTSITSLNIPASVSNIGTGITAYCSKLDSITVDSNNLDFVDCNSNIICCGTAALAGCNNSVISEGMKYFSAWAFAGLPNLTTITIGYCDHFDENAFIDLEGLTTLTIGGVTGSIYPGSFKNLTGLTTLNVSVENDLKERAFDNLPALTTLNVSAGSIFSYAFNNVPKLTTLNIDTNYLYSLGTHAFYNAGNYLTSITGSSSWFFYYVMDNTLISTEEHNHPDDLHLMEVVKLGCSNSVIPSSVEAIDSYAFNNISNSFTIDIPEGCYYIMENAFNNCTGLTSVSIPASCIDIGVDAFNGCTGLTSATFANGSLWYCKESIDSIGAVNSGFNITTGTSAANATSLTTTYVDYYLRRETANLPTDWLAYDSTNDTYYVKKGTNLSTNLTDLTIHTYYCDASGNWGNVTSINDNSFANQEYVVNVKLSPTIQTVGYRAFYSCGALTSVTFPEGNLTTFGAEIFRDDGKLTSVHIPSSVTTFGDDFIKGCANITSITVDSNNTTFYSNDSNAIIETATKTLLFGCKNTIIPDGVLTIGDEAFSWHSKLTSINIPASVVSIGSMVFNGCDGLRSISIDSRNTSFYGHGYNAIISISGGDNPDNDALIVGCSTTTIPSTVAHIQPYAFCTVRTSFTLTVPEGVRTIANNAFQNSSGLTHITLPASLTTINKAAFTGCSKLTSSTFTNSDYYWQANSKNIDVYDASDNATYLRSTYLSYDWTKTSNPIIMVYIGSTRYNTIEAALTASVSGDTVVVAAGRSAKRELIISSDCTVKSGVTLLLAYNDAATVSSSTAIYNTSTLYTAPGGTRTNLVKIADGITLTVDAGGTLDVAGQMVCGKVGSNYMGQTGGSYAELSMIGSSQIIVNGTAKCTGYINEAATNNGSLITLNGIAYLPFIVNDWRGGSYAYAAYKQNVSPFNQYQLLNITAKVKANYGCSVIAYANLNINNGVESFVIDFAGSTSDYVFQLTETNGTGNTYVTFKVTSGIIDMDFYGGMNLNPLKMSLKILISINITTENCHFPICWTTNVQLNSGTYDFSNKTDSSRTPQNVKLLPGAKLTVAHDTTLYVDDIVVYESFVDKAEDAKGLNYPTDKSAAYFEIEGGTVTCNRLAGSVYLDTWGYKLTKIIINNTGLSHFNSYETKGNFSGTAPFVSIETQTITHTTKIYYGTKSTSSYDTHTYTANTPATYTRVGDGDM